MAFGSYDESEQREEQTEVDEDEMVTEGRTDYDGDLETKTGDADSMIDQFQNEVKD